MRMDVEQERIEAIGHDEIVYQYEAQGLCSRTAAQGERTIGD